MRWKKQGLIWAPDGSKPWLQAHAMVPTPYLISPECIRLYVASTDADMVSRVGYLDLDARDPSRILRVSDDPVFDIGEAGCFDDNGVNATAVVPHGDELRMYYFGYQLGVKVRYLLFGGLAVSVDGGATFKRHSRVPIIDRSDREPLLRSGPVVLWDQGKWRMWYGAADRHIRVGDTTRPTYQIKYLESDDGINWPSEGRTAISLLSGGEEYGLGRPYVIRCEEGYRMWYSMRTHSLGYRIGYAESADGLSWTRRDDAEGLELSEQGWDSEMICYAAEVRTEYGTYLFHNGNDYGRSGVGYAVLDEN
jgi:hypothetical protein